MKVSFQKTSAYLSSLVAAGLLTAGQAHAALDASVTTGISGLQTDLLALFTALTATGIAVWVGRMIYNHFRVK